ncbi:uncharacterized protein LOC143280263 [Babylonia areolata]|uniref:uncharacterized protein LOC143280263 n=1 Tax=Babylonia areolata TaxID=304850 RepID=UPI003FD6B0BB
MVRPILEYGHAVWQPYQKTLSAELEDVQRRATRLLASMKDKSYPERLRALHLPSLEHRRLRGDMIEVYKYLHAFYNVDNPKFELADNSRRDLRGNPFKLTKSRFRLDIRGNFFSYREAGPIVVARKTLQVHGKKPSGHVDEKPQISLIL